MEVLGEYVMGLGEKELEFYLNLSALGNSTY